MHRENTKQGSVKMNLVVSENFGNLRPIEALPHNVKIFPLPPEEASSGDLCYNIDKSLFKLEKEVSLFQFALKEVQDIPFSEK